VRFHGLLVARAKERFDVLLEPHRLVIVRHLGAFLFVRRNVDNVADGAPRACLVMPDDDVAPRGRNISYARSVVL
jgi:hypothetical protein